MHRTARNVFVYTPFSRRCNRGITKAFRDHGTRVMWKHLHATCPLYPQENKIPIVQNAAWALGPICMGAENHAPTKIRFPYRPHCSQ